MKILELTNYTAGGCGVGARALMEAELLSKKGHEVKVFSSNLTKGTDRLAPPVEKRGDFTIHRFPAKKLGGESFLKWHFYTEAEKFHPDIIIAHAYRHNHTLEGLKLAKKIGAKIFLVTHAPFIEGNTTRSFLAKLAVKYYDSLLGPSRKLNQFDKVIAIAQWEIPYLRNLRVRQDKIAYIPNGIPDSFFKGNISTGKRELLFLGRVSPIKNLEILLKSIYLLKKNKVALQIVGPYEEDYLEILRGLVVSYGIEKNVEFLGPIYNIQDKIKKIDSAKVFVLPSKREAMPQALMEAMARGRIVVASDNPGSREVVVDGKNGYLFNKDNANELARKIKIALRTGKHMGNRARASVDKFKWSSIIERIEELFHENPNS